MYVTPEAVNLYLEIQHNSFFLFISLCLAVWVCLKQGSENMVLLLLLQIGAKDLTLWWGNLKRMVTFSKAVKRE